MSGTDGAGLLHLPPLLPGALPGGIALSLARSLTGRRAEGGVGRLPGVFLRASPLFLWLSFRSTHGEARGGGRRAAAWRPPPCVFPFFISELDLESRNKVSVGEPAEGSLTGSPRRQPTVPIFPLSRGLWAGRVGGTTAPPCAPFPLCPRRVPPSGVGTQAAKHRLPRAPLDRREDDQT